MKESADYGIIIELDRLRNAVYALMVIYGACGVRGCTTSGRYVRILDLREGNEESSEEITGCKASVYAEFDDCPEVGKFVKLLDFRHFERHMMFSQSDRKTYKKAISDGVNVSVVLDVGCGNT